MRVAAALAIIVARASAHGFIRSIRGANGVIMPGLSVYDGTPRNCASNACGADADTAIIRDADVNNGRPLGLTQGQGAVDPSAVIKVFMSTGRPPFANLGDCISDVETIVGDLAGQGSVYGLPTSDDEGIVNLIWRQVNTDGAGPVIASIDPSSGGSDPKAFQQAEVTLDVPGSGTGGLSNNVMSSFLIRVKMPKGMVCSGSVGGVDNICIVRVRNTASAGPFGGAAAFTQSSASRTRAVQGAQKERRFLR